MREWRTEPLGNIAEIRPSNVDKKSNPGEQPVRLCNYLDVYTRDYITEDIPFMEATATTAEIQRFLVERGDVLVTKDSETPDDIGISAVVVDDIANLVCGYHLALLKPNSELVDSVYLAKQLASAESARYFGRLANGSTRYGLSYGSIAATPIRLAPPDQQRRIAEILTTIDEAIEQTEALIAKAQQIKAGLMHDLFTRGVTPDGKLRPPREEAPKLYKQSPLGWIPKDWATSTVGECLSGIDAGHSPECPDTPAKGDQWGVLKVGAVNPEGFREEENKTVLDPTLHDSSLLVRAGDLLLSRANTVDLVGLVCHVDADPRNLMLSDKTLRLRTKSSQVQDRFLFWSLQLRATRRQIENAASGTSGSMKNISQQSIRALQLGLPDLEEQARMAARMDAADDHLKGETAEIRKLKSVKRGLMHDLLTGRVRVPVADAQEAEAHV